MLNFFFTVYGCDFSPITTRNLNTANQLVEAQNFIEAANVYRSVLANTPDKEIKIKVLVQLAQLYAFHLNRVEDSISLMEKAILISKDPLRLIKFKEILGDIYFTKLRNFKKSVDIYDELLKVRPKLSMYDEYKYRYAESLFLVNDHKNSLFVFESILNNKKNINKSKIKYRIGLINYLLNKNDEAISVFKEIIDGDFKYTYKVKSSYYLAGLYEDIDQLDNSLKYYNLIRYDYPNPELIEQKMESILRKKVETGL